MVFCWVIYFNFAMRSVSPPLPFPPFRSLGVISAVFGGRRSSCHQKGAVNYVPARSPSLDCIAPIQLACPEQTLLPPPVSLSVLSRSFPRTHTIGSVTCVGIRLVRNTPYSNAVSPILQSCPAQLRRAPLCKPDLFLSRFAKYYRTATPLQKNYGAPYIHTCPHDDVAR